MAQNTQGNQNGKVKGFYGWFIGDVYKRQVYRGRLFSALGIQYRPSYEPELTFYYACN